MRGSEIYSPGIVMSAINPLANPDSSGPVQKIIQHPIQKEVPPEVQASQGPTVDKLDISGVSHLLTALRSNDIRADKVEQIRAQIQSGTYEDDQKLDVAVDRLLDEFQR